MVLLVDILYLFLAIIFSPWLLYSFAFKARFRQGLMARCGLRELPPPIERSIWLHGSSAGEIMLLKPLVEQLQSQLPNARLVISTYTSTGQQAARKAYPQHTVIYFPFDLSLIVNRFLRRLKPALIIIVESEFWPNFILCAHRADVPVVLLNGKMSAKSCKGYKKTRLVPYVLKKFTLLAVQNQEYAERFRELGVAAEKIHITGNMKYDLPLDYDKGLARDTLRQEFGYPQEDTIVVGGSTHSGEHEALIYALGRLREDGYRLHLILVPRYPEEADEVVQIVEKCGLTALKRTSLPASGSGGSLEGSNTVLIVDTVGELRKFYAISNIAYVGGSLLFRRSNKGGHNLMEPATLGLAVLFGPYNYSFRDTVATLLKESAGIMVQNQEDLYQQLHTLLAEPRSIAELGQKARAVMDKERGASARNLELLTSLLQR
jgi:3-deoxy-D-manno-octulosonic-acid transferase